MKKLFFLFVIPLILFNCDKDDDGNAPLSFLEKHQGTVWQDSSSGEEYFRFINNVNSPLESWFFWVDCYEYDLAVFGEGQTININSNNTFEVETVEFDGLNEYLDIITLTISGNSLELSYRYYENGEMYASGSEFYTASTVDVDSLTLC